MNKLREIKSIGISISLISILIGIILVVKPRQVQVLLNTSVGLGLIFIGLLGITRYIYLKKKGAINNYIYIIPMAIAILGIFVLLTPTLTLFVVGILISVIAIIMGIENMFSGFSLGRRGESGSFLLIFGIIHIIFGVFMAWNTFATMMAIIMIVGVYLIVFGVSVLATIFMIKDIELDDKKKIDVQERFEYNVEVTDYEEVDK